MRTQKEKTDMADAIKQLRVVAFQEGDSWIAQCVDYDLCVQGADLAQVKRRMTALIQLETDFTTKNNGALFAGIDPAPDYFTAMFDGAEESLAGEMDFRLAA
jgi:hypothetical protein